MISQDTIEKVFDAAHVEEVVGEFVSLKKKGNNMWGLCPFHNEKTPSFSVSPSKGIYKCFGCGEAGNAVNFLMEHDKMSYPEAIRWLAQRYSIEVQETGENKDDLAKHRERRESLIIVSEHASEFFQKQLRDTDEGRSHAESYFKERSISLKMQKLFKLGYSPESRDALAKEALNAGYKKEFLVESGLVVETENGLFDRFRGRVIFPIHNLSGRVVAFGGRILKSGVKAAKYLNSPESPIYHKGKILYGLFESRKAIRKEKHTLIVEGYTDLIRLHQVGIENVVATSGTALTEEQTQLLRRFTENVTIIFDGDPAGLKAALRGIDVLLKAGLNVSALALPEGEDPDSYASKVGKQGFLNFLDAERSDLIEFKTKLLLADAGSDPVRRAEAVRSIVESISHMPDPIKRAAFIQKAGTDLEMPEELLYNEVSSQISKNKGISTRERQYLQKQQKPQRAAAQEKEDQGLRNDDYQESDIIRLLLHYAEIRISDELSVGEFLVHEFSEIRWDRQDLFKVFLIFKNALETGEEVDQKKLSRHSDPEVSKLCVKYLSQDYKVSHNWAVKHDIRIKELDQNVAKDVVSATERLKLKKVLKMAAENRELLKNPELKDEEVLHILEVQKKLDEAKKTLARSIGSVIVE